MKYKEIFNPKTIAVIGAVEKKDSVGRGVIENLSNKKRRIFFVNPFKKRVFGQKTYGSVIEIKEKIDLAIVVVPKTAVKAVIKDLAKKGVGGVIIISAGFAETGKSGKKEEDEIKKILEDAKIPLIGPNCLGIIRPSTMLNASFAPATPREGKIALISQSGALINSIIDKSLTENYGFSVVISVGNAAGLDLVDYLRWADEDKKTEVIALYIEGLKSGRSFFNVLKKTKKSVVILKGGKTERGKKTVFSHTGSLAGKKEIFSAAIKQAGAIEVCSIEELFDVSKALAWQNRFNGGAGVITNGGGAGVLFADAYNSDMPKLSKKTIAFLDSCMHPSYSRSNPLDIVGDALSARYKKALEAMVGQKNIKAIAIIQTLQIMTDPLKNAKIIVELKKKTEKPIITVFMGGSKKIKEAIDLLEKNKIPNYSDPKRGAIVLKILNKKDI